MIARTNCAGYSRGRIGSGGANKARNSPVHAGLIQPRWGGGIFSKRVDRMLLHQN